MKTFDSSKINFSKSGGLVPAVVQDVETAVVLMIGYMNAEALSETLKRKRVTFWSRSKQRLWEKGETSGNYLDLVSVRADCDGDALLIKARPQGPTCHSGTISCFGAGINGDVVSELFTVIQQRKQAMPEGSYTAQLLAQGTDAICAKVTEESEEVVRAAKCETKQRVTEEAADVLYHLLVLLADQEVHWDNVLGELQRRKNPGCLK